MHHNASALVQERNHRSADRGVVRGFEESQRESPQRLVKELVEPLPSKSKHGHLPVHLVETIGMVVVLMMQQEQHALEPLVTKRDPFRGGYVSLVIGRQASRRAYIKASPIREVRKRAAVGRSTGGQPL